MTGSQRCQYCNRPHKVSAESHAESPFCVMCLKERELKHQVEDYQAEDTAVRDLCRPIVGEFVDRPEIGGNYIAALRPLRDVVKATVLTMQAGRAAMAAAVDASDKAMTRIWENLVESVAEEIYSQWDEDEGFVPWVRSGNSDKQHLARQYARRALSKGKAVADQKPKSEPQQGAGMTLKAKTTLDEKQMIDLLKAGFERMYHGRYKVIGVEFECREARDRSGQIVGGCVVSCKVEFEEQPQDPS